MRAALRFVRELDAAGLLEKTERVRVDLYGSLALTGLGHGTDRAILLGLMGEVPDTVDPATVDAKIAEVRSTDWLPLGGRAGISFQKDDDLRFRRDQMYPEAGVVSHPNGVRFTAFDAAGAVISTEVFYSIGGGFIVSEAERLAEGAGGVASTRVVPYPFRSAEELLRIGASYKTTIAEIVLANECALYGSENLHETGPRIRRPGLTSLADLDLPLHEQIQRGILALWRAMQACTRRGMETEGVLPGGLNVRRRAARLARRLEGEEPSGRYDPLAALDWVTMWAMAVNEENAAGGRVVTAPTNGAAGVVPAIAHYYLRFLCEGMVEEEKEPGLLGYFLTAAAIGILYKENASISGAEVGCQGEVGVACSMAAGGLVAAQGGTNAQVEHAAEVAMEHSLGMTCDPIGGLVQIPCIERNGMGAVKAINASRIAMHETEGHKLSLDQVIRTMYETGMDMQSRYKETSLAGLALNVIEC
jgi:L-serine dehydratase